MYKGKTFLGLILARGGSKGVPNKNIRLLHGKPLIAYSIEALKNSGIFDRIIVSTDSKEIADVAQSYGADIPFMRPAHLAEDNSAALDVIEHALQWLKSKGEQYDYVQYVMPTAPLRTADDIKQAATELINGDLEMVISVCETEHPLAWMNILPDDLSMRNFLSKEHRSRGLRQEAQKSYRLNGAIFVGKWDVFALRRDFYDVKSKAYIMPQERSIDIDTLRDFEYVEFLMENKNVHRTI